MVASAMTSEEIHKDIYVFFDNLEKRIENKNKN
jgi:hypothetical protein